MNNFMKNMAYRLCLIFTIIVIASSTYAQGSNVAKTPQMDDGIESFMAEYHKAIKDKDVNAVSNLTTENLMLCGTDPSELWDKASTIQQFTEMAKMEDLHLDFKVSDRQIRPAKDGQTAIVQEQAMISFISEIVPVRTVYHLVKSGETWKADFISSALIPTNAEIPVINKAVAEATPHKVDYQALGERIATTSAHIQPGDVVVVYGGKHTIDLMEAIAIEVQKKGGLVRMFLETDQLQYSLYHDVSDAYLSQEPTYFKEWFKEIDVWIGLPSTKDFKMIYKDVPEEKFALMNKAFQSFNEALNSSKVRGVFVTYPTKNQAEETGLDFETYEKIKWAAVNADYDKIGQDAKKLESLLMASKSVKITTPAGTDISFSVADRACLIDDGIVTKEDAQSSLIFQRTANLPGGFIYTTIIEDSANGKVVVPRTKCNYEFVENISFKFKDGVMDGLKNDCILDEFKPYEGDANRIAGVQIGLNPMIEVIQNEKTDFREGSSAGLVYLGVGDNSLNGGQNKVEGQFSYYFPLTDATVEIDGVVVVKDGQLNLD